MPKYNVCILAANREAYPNGLSKAILVDEDDLYTDSGRLELAKTLWQRMLRRASKSGDAEYTFKIGEGAGTKDEEALISAQPLVKDLFEINDAGYLNPLNDDMNTHLAHRPGKRLYYPEGYGDKDNPDVVAIIYEVESSAKSHEALAREICSSKVKDQQLKRVLIFLPVARDVLNRFEAQDLIEAKPKKLEQQTKVKSATPQDAAKSTSSKKPDKEVAKPAKSKSSKTKKSHASSSKPKAAAPFYGEYYYKDAVADLLKAITNAQQEYKKLKRTKHKKEFQRLVDRLNDIKENEPYEVEGEEERVVAKARYKKMIGEVQFALRDAQSDFSKPLLKMGKRKTWDEYATKVIHSKSSYQYPKLLSKILHDVYSKKDPVAEAGLDSMRTKLKEIYSAIDKINDYLTKKSTTKLKK